MNIVVLDSSPLDKDGLAWEAFKRYGDVILHKHSEPEEVVSLCANARVVFTNKVSITGDMLRQLPDLKLICIMATGVNVIDLEVATELGITVCNVPAYSSDAVAQHAFALLLELTNKVGTHNRLVKQGVWSHSVDFSFWKTPLQELQGRKFGIVGFGQTGQRTAKIADAMGMQVKVLVRASLKEVPDYVEVLSFEDLVEQCDVISLHASLTDENYHLFNEHTFRRMKKSAILINTARGSLIDEKALAEALRDGEIAGAALDVLEQEPPRSDNPLFASSNCIITPHMAWAAVESRKRLLYTLYYNVAKFMDGTPQNVVNF